MSNTKNSIILVWFGRTSLPGNKKNINFGTSLNNKIKIHLKSDKIEGKNLHCCPLIKLFEPEKGIIL